MQALPDQEERAAPLSECLPCLTDRKDSVSACQLVMRHVTTPSSSHVTLRDLAFKKKAEEIFSESTESQTSVPNKEEIRNQVKVESETFSVLEAGDCSFGTFFFRQLWMITLMFDMKRALRTSFEGKC